MDDPLHSPERMRIMVAHSFYRQPGGEDRYVTQQIELLAPRHDVRLLTRSNAELDVGLSTAARMTFSRSDRQWAQESIERFAPDVVHLHNPYPSLGPAVHLATERTATPLVLTVHNLRLRCPNAYQFTEGSLCTRCERGNYLQAVLHECFPSRLQSGAYAMSLWIHRFVLRLENNVRMFIAPSSYMHAKLLAWGLPSERIVMIRNFTDIPAAASAEPGEYGLYLGRLSSEKGVETLLEALRLAGDPPFRFAGDGPLAGALRDRAQALSLRNTRFLGQLDVKDIAPVLRAARFVVLPSTWHENAPMAALEAMAAGRPLIVTRRGGLPELAGDGRGELCEAGDADQLASSIVQLMTDAQRCQEAGTRAIEFARAELAPDVHASRLEMAYRGAACTAAEQD